MVRLVPECRVDVVAADEHQCVDARQLLGQNVGVLRHGYYHGQTAGLLYRLGICAAHTVARLLVDRYSDYGTHAAVGCRQRDRKDLAAYLCRTVGELRCGGQRGEQQKQGVEQSFHIISGF